MKILRMSLFVFVAFFVLGFVFVGNVNATTPVPVINQLSPTHAFVYCDPNETTTDFATVVGSDFDTTTSIVMDGNTASPLVVKQRGENYAGYIGPSYDWISFYVPNKTSPGTHAIQVQNPSSPLSNSLSLLLIEGNGQAPCSVGGGGGGGGSNPVVPPEVANPMSTATPTITSISPISGLAGRVIDLYGTALDNAEIVILDGDKKQASMPTNGDLSILKIPNSSTHLNFVVPFGTPGIHTIQLSRRYPPSWDGSLTLSNSIPFTILRETLNSVSPTSLRACETLTLYGANYNRSTFASFDGDVTTYKLKIPIEVAPDGTSEKVSIPGLAPGVHTVQVKIGGGTWSASSMSNPVTFTVLPGGCATDSSYNIVSSTTPSSNPPSNTTNSSSPTNQSNPINYSSEQPSNSYNFGSTTLYRGVRGDAVKELQRFFNENLNLNLVLDGKFGPKTTAIVKKWQKDHGLKEDGRVGPKTKAIMSSEVK